MTLALWISSNVEDATLFAVFATLGSGSLGVTARGLLTGQVLDMADGASGEVAYDKKPSSFVISMVIWAFGGLIAMAMAGQILINAFGA